MVMLKVRIAGDGLLAKCLVIPAGKESTISPVIFTTHLDRGNHYGVYRHFLSHDSLEEVLFLGRHGSMQRLAKKDRSEAYI